MKRLLAAVAASLAAGVLLMAPSPERKVIELPAGTLDVRAELLVESGTLLRGAPEGTVLRMTPDFDGRAAIVARGEGIRIERLTIEGNRETRDVRTELPAYDMPFARFTKGNGILALDSEGLTIERVKFRRIGGFAVLVSRARRVVIARIEVEESGGRNRAGRNNTTGGILLEEGASQFQVTDSTLRDIRGNGIWTHSLYTSPRNGPGVIAGNRVETVGRDAIQVGHAFGVTVAGNSGRRIGFPVEDVDVEGRAIPVAIDTAGNVDRTSYRDNRFEEINGKCIDLDGFHHGEVRGNVCINRGAPEAYPHGGYGIVMNNTNPDMQSEAIQVVGNRIERAQFGGIFVIGTGHVVTDNQFLDLNIAHCNEEAARFGCYYAPGEPDMLRSGIYLGRGAERPAPARGNRIEGNRIQGFGMRTRCVGWAPGIEPAANIVRGNDCVD